MSKTQPMPPNDESKRNAVIKIQLAAIAVYLEGFRRGTRAGSCCQGDLH